MRLKRLLARRALCFSTLAMVGLAVPTVHGAREDLEARSSAAAATEQGRSTSAPFCWKFKHTVVIDPTGKRTLSEERRHQVEGEWAYQGWNQAWEGRFSASWTPPPPTVSCEVRPFNWEATVSNRNPAPDFDGTLFNAKMEPYNTIDIRCQDNEGEEKITMSVSGSDLQRVNRCQAKIDPGWGAPGLELPKFRTTIEYVKDGWKSWHFEYIYTYVTPTKPDATVDIAKEVKERKAPLMVDLRCETKPDPSACWREVAVAERDVQYCERIQEMAGIKLCRIAVAAEAGDEDYCKSVVGAEEQICDRFIQVRRFDDMAGRMPDPLTSAGYKTWSRDFKNRCEALKPESDPFAYGYCYMAFGAQHAKWFDDNEWREPAKRIRREGCKALLRGFTQLDAARNKDPTSPDADLAALLQTDHRHELLLLARPEYCHQIRNRAELDLCRSLAAMETGECREILDRHERESCERIYKPLFERLSPCREKRQRDRTTPESWECEHTVKADHLDETLPPAKLRERLAAHVTEPDEEDLQTPGPSPWNPTTTPYDPSCGAGCEELFHVRDAHGADMKLQFDPLVDDAIAQWGDCLQSVADCIADRTTVKECVAGSTCPESCRQTFSARAGSEHDPQSLLDIFEEIFVNDGAQCAPRERGPAL